MRTVIDFYTVIKNFYTNDVINNFNFLILETSLIGKALDFGSNEYGFESLVSNLINWDSYLTNQLHLGSLHKKLKLTVRFSNRNLLLLQIFKRIGAVANYFLFKKARPLVNVFVYYYRTIPLFKTFKTVSTPSRFFFITLKMLKLLNKKTHQSLYILSSSYGVLTHKEALKKHCGGKILFFIQ